IPLEQSYSLRTASSSRILVGREWPFRKYQYFHIALTKISHSGSGSLELSVSGFSSSAISLLGCQKKSPCSLTLLAWRNSPANNNRALGVPIRPNGIPSTFSIWTKKFNI